MIPALVLSPRVAVRFAMKWILPAILAAPLAAEPVTYHGRIEPLIYPYCAPCHRPGEAGPFPLLSYEDVRKRAAQIVSVTRSRYMPPWLPEPGFGDFAGERRLSETQLRLIEEWVRQGAPEGSPTGRPAPHFTEGWQIGPPDLVVQMPAPYRLAADGENSSAPPLRQSYCVRPCRYHSLQICYNQIRPGCGLNLSTALYSNWPQSPSPG